MLHNIINISVSISSDDLFLNLSNDTMNTTFINDETSRNTSQMSIDPNYLANSSFNTSFDWDQFDAQYILLVSILFLCLTLVTVFGNCLVIAAIALDTGLRRAQYYLILSLAVADLLVGLTVMPVAGLNDVLGQQWILGPIVCDLWISFDVMCCTASILHLLAIALDRYWSITSVRYSQRRNLQHIGGMITLTWLISFVVSVAPVLGWKDAEFHHRLHEERICLISQDVGYQIFSTATAFYIPLVVILILYYHIYKIARKRVRNRNQTAERLLMMARKTALEVSGAAHPSQPTRALHPTPEPFNTTPKSSVNPGQVTNQRPFRRLQGITNKTRNSTASEYQPRDFETNHEAQDRRKVNRQNIDQTDYKLGSMQYIDERNENGAVETRLGGKGFKKRNAKPRSYSLIPCVEISDNTEGLENVEGLKLGHSQFFVNKCCATEGNISSNAQISTDSKSIKIPYRMLDNTSFGNNCSRAKSLYQMTNYSMVDKPIASFNCPNNYIAESRTFHNMLPIGESNINHGIASQSYNNENNAQNCFNTSSQCTFPPSSHTFSTRNKCCNINATHGNKVLGSIQTRLNKSLFLLHLTDYSPLNPTFPKGRSFGDIIEIGFDSFPKQKHYEWTRPNYRVGPDPIDCVPLVKKESRKILDCSRAQNNLPNFKPLNSLIRFGESSNPDHSLPPKKISVGIKDTTSAIISTDDHSQNTGNQLGSHQYLCLARPSLEKAYNLSPKHSNASCRSNSAASNASKSVTSGLKKIHSHFRPDTALLTINRNRDSVSPKNSFAGLVVPIVTGFGSVRQLAHNRSTTTAESAAAALRERRAAMTLAIVTGTFCICWLPFFTLAVIRPICAEGCNWPPMVDSFTLWLGYINSTVNPIIYTIFSPDFRKAFSRLFRNCGRSCYNLRQFH